VIFLSENTLNYKEHFIEINNRGKIKLSGVVDILNFDDETITLLTVMGKLIIKGDELKILSFVNETGDMMADGKINAVVYLNDSKGKNSLIGKLFK
jgi:sporulation protein YabP